MKDKYYYVLSDCLSRRQEWISEIEIYFRFRELREKAEKETFSKNLTIYLLYKLINLPSNILNFLSKIQLRRIWSFTPIEISCIILIRRPPVEGVPPGCEANCRCNVESRSHFDILIP